MDQNDFNRSMDSYLKTRKSGKSNLLSKFKNAMPQVEIIAEDDDLPLQENIPIEHVQAVMRGESISHKENPVIVSSEDEVSVFEDEDLGDDSPNREGFFSRFWRFFSFESSTDLVGEDSGEPVDLSLLDPKPKKAVDDDVKEMLRTCVIWVNKLPPAEIQEIRRSEEYRKFKELLDKYGLLKK